MKSEDRKRLSDMLAHGEDAHAIVAFFKVMGYKEKEVMDELTSAEPGTHVEAEPQDREVQVFKIDTGKKKKAEDKVMRVLLVCFALFALYMLYPYLPSDEVIIDEDTQWLIGITDADCFPESAKLTIQNVQMPELPATQFRVKENNASCEPIIALNTVFAKTEVTCTGKFADNETYTVVSNHTIEEWFTCRHQ
ncbi:hypothetical protein ACFLQ2_01285 [archaeon]